MKPERIQLDSRSSDRPRLVRYEGGLGDVVKVQLRQAGRIVRFDLEAERVRELPAADARDLFAELHHFVELTVEDEAFAARFALDAVPEQVERDEEGRIVHSLLSLAAVIVAKSQRRSAKKTAAKKTAAKKSAAKTPTEKATKEKS